MGICRICNNEKQDNAPCQHCGSVFDSYQVLFLKKINYFQMTVTDKYLVFSDSTNLAGDAAATLVGGMFGASLLKSAKSKASKNKIGMLDIKTIKNIEVFFPSSKMQGGAIKINFNSGKDLILGVYESGSQKPNLTNLIKLLVHINLNVTVNEVKSLPALKMSDPIAKKSKQLLVTVSKSATEFIAPFKGMIVVE